MTISAISDQSNNLYQLLQAFQSSSSTAQPGVNIASTTKVASADSDGDADGSGSSGATSAAAPATSSTGTNPQAGTLLQQLQTSVQNALSNLDPSAANNPSDVYKAVSQAIDSTLKANGVDTSKAHGHGHHHHHGSDAESGSGTPIEQFLLGEFRADVLRVGAPGRLMMSGELDEVLPVDDSTLLKAANPVQKDGTIRLDLEIIERREDAMVKNLLEGGSVTVVVLGGAHDFTNNIPKSCEYVRVKTRRYAEAAEGILESVSKSD